MPSFYTRARPSSRSGSGEVIAPLPFVVRLVGTDLDEVVGTHPSDARRTQGRIKRARISGLVTSDEATATGEWLDKAA